MSYIDVTGKTEDEAISNALRQLGLERDDVSVEILERAKSGFLGLGAQPAKIRVTYGPRDEETAPAEKAPEAPVEKKPEPVKARELIGLLKREMLQRETLCIRPQDWTGEY